MSLKMNFYCKFSWFNIESQGDERKRSNDNVPLGEYQI